MIRRPPRSTQSRSSAASDVYKRQIVFHSVTKFINGHADVVGGIIVAKDPAVCKQLRAMMVVLGCNMDPHQAFLVSRGVKTLSLRVERAQENAMKVARWLEAHPKVEWVRYCLLYTSDAADDLLCVDL